ncbi:DUF2637 domain-containing protein [Actinomadura nitritigenes]|uniref:DUF2637 domain-containing protein n=1 Tax=Actinomadura nitritigenes TaxID=134602 RepID=UPI003D8F1F72
MKVSAIRASTAAVVVGIGAIAAYISYRHALDVATAHGEPGSTGRLVPLTIDGLVYVASMVLLDAARRRAPVPFLARPALALGIGATVAVNVLHGIAHGPVGAVIAAWPAVTLVVVVELLMGMIRRGREAGASVASTGLDEGQDLTPRAAAVPLPWWPLPEIGSPVASALPPEGPQVNDAAAAEDAEDDAPVIASARDRFAELLADGNLPSVRRIRKELRVGHPRAVRVREALAGEVA